MRTGLYIAALIGLLILAYRIVLPILIEAWHDLGEDEPWGDEWQK